jgi:hypothetical protein
VYIVVTVKNIPNTNTTITISFKDIKPSTLYLRIQLNLNQEEVYMNFVTYLEELRFRASRCRLSQKVLAEKAGMSVATINDHLNHPEKMRLWELQKISDIIEQEENDKGIQWPPEGGVIGYERSLRSAPQPLGSSAIYR